MFTAEELRAGNPAGRLYRYRVEEGGAHVGFELLRFVEVDDEGAVIESWRERPDGRAAGPRGEAARARASWEELASHGVTPVGSERTREVITTPAGRFRCRRVTIRGEHETTRLWFADELPGPPVRHETRRAEDEQALRRSELVSTAIE
ncbi:MAG: hypothetical protein KC468_01635 [Myxococcales bacterium]|nr:hypothetical protein [Myxococcales bacterium]